MNIKVMQVLVRPSIVWRAAAIALAVGAQAGLAIGQAIYHVAPCGDDGWTGATTICAAPDGPKRTIQGAINASVDGDTVLVAAGLYMGPGNREMDFGGRAITVRGEGRLVCTIDCEGSHATPHRAFHFHSGETEASVLEGFTIKRGWVPDFGGAVLCQSSAPLIRGCTFDVNGSERGGAIYVAFVPTGFSLIDCSFSQNSTTLTGGALYISNSSVTLSNCVFTGNTAFGGGAIVSAGAGSHTYTDCSFTGNISTNPSGNGGGAIQTQGSEPPDKTEAIDTYINCFFTGNRGGRIGGGVWASRQVDATFTDCRFIGNYAPVRASGLGVSFDSRATVTNCLFASNTGQASVGALWVGDGVGGPSTATVVNCTFANNGEFSDTGLSVTQSSTLVATNCIYWGNVNPILTEAGTSVSISFSDIQGGWAGAGHDNLSPPADPHFVDAVAGDYRLAPFSPCIDRGDNSAVPSGIVTDLAGLPRFVDDPWMPNRSLPPVDMGAYEFQGNSCPADFNHDAALNSQDFFDFLGAFFVQGPGADFNGDGTVNSQDYFDFNTAFFAGCA